VVSGKGGVQSYSLTLQLLALMTVLTLLPSMLLMMTQVMMILWTKLSRKCMRSWSKCLLFNPLRADKAGKKSSLRPVPSIVRRVNSTDANADEQLLNELRKGNGEDKEVRDGSDHEVSSSSEALAQAGRRTRYKSKG
jgi:hypothetical protein